MLKNLKKYIKSYVYKKRLCYKNNSFLHVGVTVSHSTCLEGYNIIYYNTNIVDSSIGAGSYIGMDSQIVKTKVGRFTSIGNRVKTCFGSHPTSKFISTHPSFFSIDKQAGFSFVKKNIFEEYKYFDSKNKIICDIGNDVWIGDNVCIMDGLKIGDGAIIGAGSIVTKDIEPYSINVGVPSRPVSYRFTPDKIKLLQNIAWWNKDLEWIKNNSEFFKDIDLFLNKLNETK